MCIVPVPHWVKVGQAGSWAMPRSIIIHHTRICDHETRIFDEDYLWTYWS
jgi:hypothetical protein